MAQRAGRAARENGEPAKILYEGEEYTLLELADVLREQYGDMSEKESHTEKVLFNLQLAFERILKKAHGWKKGEGFDLDKLDKWQRETWKLIERYRDKEAEK